MTPAEQTVLVDGVERPRPVLHPCKACGRAPELLLGYRGTEGEAKGWGPYFVMCHHGETEEEAKRRHADEEARLFRGEPMTSYDASTPGIWRTVVTRGPLFYRSWDFDRAVAGWNASHPPVAEVRELEGAWL